MTDDHDNMLDGLGDVYDEAEELVSERKQKRNPLQRDIEEPTEPVTCVGCIHRRFIKGAPWTGASKFVCALTGYEAIRRCNKYEGG